MRLLNAAAAALVASCFTAVAASPSPNFEISKTSVNIDKHREKLDNGEIIVRVQRTDDLFSDPTANAEAKLLLEKNTHIALRIQLDVESGKVNVNDESLDIMSPHGASLSGIKVETIRLPAGHDGPVVDADQMLELVNQLSLGIAKVEVKLETEPLSPTLGLSTYTEGEPLPSIEVLTVRKVGLFIRITEIEGKLLSHTTSIYTSILQLVVVSSGDRVNKIATLAIDGKAPIEDAIGSMPGPVMGMALPAKEEMRKARPFHGHHEHHHERPSSSGMFGWLARMFGLRVGREEQHGRHGFRGGRPRGGCKKWQEKHAQELAAAAAAKESGGEQRGRLATHRPMVENPFSGMVDDDGDDEGYASASEEERKKQSETVEDRQKAIAHSGVGLGFGGGAPIGAHRRPHHRQHGQDGQSGHRRHGRCGGSFRRFVVGFVSGMSLVGNFLFNPISMLVICSLFVGGMVLGLLLDKKRRNGGIALGEDEEKEQKEPLMMDDEKKEMQVALNEVVVEETETLPVYEGRA